MSQKDQEIFDDADEENVDVIDQYKELRNCSEKSGCEADDKARIFFKNDPEVGKDAFSNKTMEKGLQCPSSSSNDSQDFSSNTRTEKVLQHPSPDSNDSKLKTASKNMTWSPAFHDLAGILPEKDCLFLAVQFWIFSVEQLVFILQGDSSNKTLPHDRDTDQSKMTTKEDITIALMRSTLIGSESNSQAKGFDAAEMNKVLQAERQSEDSSTPNTDAPLNEKNEPTKSKNNLNENTKELKMKAGYRIMLWENALSLFLCDNIVTGKSCRLFQHETFVQNMTKKKFDLRGPLSILFPNYVLKFFKSMKIWTSDQFLQAKKTESSKLVSRFTKWREKNRMLPMKPIVLSRYLTGLCTRIQYATSLVPSANEFERGWMGSCLCVLTGSSREFLIGICKFKNHDEFLKTKTKTLSTLVVEWRKTKGMPPLKGSGKVAIISGWKTLVKETIDANTETKQLTPSISDENPNSKVPVSSDNEATIIAKDTSHSRPTETEKEKSVTNESNESDVSSKVPSNDKISVASNLQGEDHSPLKSTLWLRTLLKPANIDFLNSVGIKNAEQLLLANKRSNGALVSSLLRWRKLNGFNNVQPSSVERALYDWTLKVREKLHEAGVVNLDFNVNRRGRPRKIATGNEPCNSQQEDDANNQDEVLSENADNQKKVGNSAKQDPILKLSENSRRFLQSMNIVKAGDLLSSPSSFVAENYIQWRKDHGITALKGNGAIATVSGWKNAVRSDSKPSGNSDFDCEPSRFSVKRKKFPIFSPSQKIKKLANDISRSVELSVNPFMLLGMPSFCFTVFNPIKDMFFDFKLSVQKKNNAESNDISVFLTYVGGRCLKKSPVPYSSSSQSKNYEANIPILPEVSESDMKRFLDAEPVSRSEKSEHIALTESSYITFCSKYRECGLLDITRFNIFPKKKEYRTKELITLLDSFISCKICVPEKLKSNATLNRHSESLSTIQADTHRTDDSLTNISSKEGILNKDLMNASSPNVFPCCSTPERDDYRYLVFIDDHLENGQSVELSLGPKIDDSFGHTSRLESDMDLTAFSCKKNIQERENILTLVASLSMQELQQVVVPLHSVFLSLKLDLKSFLRKRDEIVDLIPPPKILEHLIIFRRFSWIAGTLDSHMGHLQKNHSNINSKHLFDWNNAEQMKTKQLISEMSWTSFHQDEVEFLVEFSDGFLFHGVQDEISEEILTLLSIKKLIIYPFDDRFWCPMSSTLLFNLLDNISSYVIMTTLETHKSQNELFQVILHQVNKVIQTLEDGCNLSEHLSPAAYKRFLEQISFQPSNSYSSSLQNLADLKTSDFVEEKSDAHGVKSFQECFLYCETENKNTVTDVLKASLTVEKKWYFIHQILFVAHNVASCGMIKWSKIKSDSNDRYVYSFSRLQSALIHKDTKRVKTFQQIAFQSIYLPTTLPILNSSLFSMGDCVESLSKTAPKSNSCTLPLFLQIIWPMLKEKGWQIAVTSPSTLIYELSSHPKVYSENELSNSHGDRSTRFHSKLTKEILDAKKIQVPLILKRILVHSIFSVTKNEGQKEKHDKQDEKVSSYSVNNMLQKYTKFVCSKSNDNSGNESKTILLVIESVERLFNETVCNYMFESEIRYYKAHLKNRKKSEFLSCEYFIRVAIMLPYDLKRASIRVCDVDIMISVIEDILKFLSLEDDFTKSILLSDHDTKENSPKTDSRSFNHHMKMNEFFSTKQFKSNNGIVLYHHTDVLKFLFCSDYLEKNPELEDCIDSYYSTLKSRT